MEQSMIFILVKKTVCSFLPKTKNFLNKEIWVEKEAKRKARK